MENGSSYDREPISFLAFPRELADRKHPKIEPKWSQLKQKPTEKWPNDSYRVRVDSFFLKNGTRSHPTLSPWAWLVPSARSSPTCVSAIHSCSFYFMTPKFQHGDANWTLTDQMIQKELSCCWQCVTCEPHQYLPNETTCADCPWGYWPNPSKNGEPINQKRCLHFSVTKKHKKKHSHKQIALALKLV